MVNAVAMGSARTPGSANVTQGTIRRTAQKRSAPTIAVVGERVISRQGSASAQHLPLEMIVGKKSARISAVDMALVRRREVSANASKDTTRLIAAKNSVRTCVLGVENVTKRMVSAPARMVSLDLTARQSHAPSKTVYFAVAMEIATRRQAYAHVTSPGREKIAEIGHVHSAQMVCLAQMTVYATG
jgi:hypothetical protein